MEINTHQVGSKKVAEVVSENYSIKNLDEALQLLGDLYYNGFHKIVLRQEHLSPSFYDLKSQLAGDILQKFANFQMQLAIVGDFEQVESKSLKDFIYESNQATLISFCKHLDEALS